MSTLYLWQKIVLALLACLSLIAGYQAGSGGSILNAVMTLIINVLIVYGIFKLGNKVFRSKKVQ